MDFCMILSSKYKSKCIFVSLNIPINWAAVYLCNTYVIVYVIHYSVFVLLVESSWLSSTEQIYLKFIKEAQNWKEA